MRRIARIYPGYWVQLLVVALVFAPIAAALGYGTWTIGAAVHYINADAWLMSGLPYLTLPWKWEIDGISFPWYGAWNGSSWTLMYELLAYLGCLALFSLPWARRHVTLTASACVAILLLFDSFGAQALDVNTNFYLNSARLSLCFMVGALAFGLRRKIVASWYIFIPTALACTVMAIYNVPLWITIIPWAYVMLAGGCLIPWRLGNRNDLSYGVYIYAFPIQQMMTVFGIPSLGGQLGSAVHLLATSALTLVLAALSWRFIEAPSMQLGRKLSRTRARASATLSPRSA